MMSCLFIRIQLPYALTIVARFEYMLCLTHNKNKGKCVCGFVITVPYLTLPYLALAWLLNTSGATVNPR